MNVNKDSNPVINGTKPLDKRRKQDPFTSLSLSKLIWDHQLIVKDRIKYTRQWMGEQELAEPIEVHQTNSKSKCRLGYRGPTVDALDLSQPRWLLILMTMQNRGLDIVELM